MLVVLGSAMGFVNRFAALGLTGLHAAARLAVFECGGPLALLFLAFASRAPRRLRLSRLLAC